MSGGRVVMIIGVLLLVVAIIVGGIWWFRSRGGADTPQGDGQDGDSTYVPPPGIVEIVVAEQNIPRGTWITSDNNAVHLVAWPEDALPDDYFTTLEVTYDRVARTDIVRGMPIVEGVLTDDAGDLASVGSDAALQIPSGRVAYALAVAGNASVAWAIEPGDHVDVLITLPIIGLDEEYQTTLPNAYTCISPTPDEGCVENMFGRLEALPNGWIVNVVPSQNSQRPRLVTQMTVQDAMILRVGSWEEEEVVQYDVTTGQPVTTSDGSDGDVVQQPQPTSVESIPEAPLLVRWVTLVVSPQDALLLKYLEEVGASMDFVLRSAQDAGAGFATQQVTLDYLFQNYIQEPAALPYGVSLPVALYARLGAAGEVIEFVGEENDYSRWHWVSTAYQQQPEQ